MELNRFARSYTAKRPTQEEIKAALERAEKVKNKQQIHFENEN